MHCPRLCLKRQVIDLLAEGYTSEQLDAQPPVKVEDWYCGRTDCGCTYQMTVCLLNENHEVIQEFKPDPVTLDPETTEDCSWKQISHTFSEYGAGCVSSRLNMEDKTPSSGTVGPGPDEIERQKRWGCYSPCDCICLQKASNCCCSNSVITLFSA
ncbi:hypothetical protein INR49_016795 [Caranx melampygus]|nr:hypothetical protein INR49_016795 [Caranx melampygus]